MTFMEVKQDNTEFQVEGKDIIFFYIDDQGTFECLNLNGENEPDL